MNYGLIKEGVCINVIVLESEPTEDDKTALIPTMCDEMVAVPVGFWVGDGYINEVWKKVGADTPTEPTPEDYLVDLDYRLSLVELGL